MKDPLVLELADKYGRDVGQVGGHQGAIGLAERGSEEPQTRHASPFIQPHPSPLHAWVQVLVRWALQRGTSVLPKSVNPSRIRSNIEHVVEWALSEEDFKRLSSLELQVRR
jgi:hypothetical protein